MAGQELVFAIQRAVKKFPPDRFVIQTKTKATGLKMSADGKRVTGIEYSNLKDKSSGVLEAGNVVIATGGFASGGVMLQKYRPDLVKFPTTNGLWATGDGLAMAEESGASLYGIKDVQVHPTAFVNQAKPNESRKTLCAEILRGVGGLLLDRHGKRFANELGKRDYVTAQMLASAGHDAVAPNTFTIFLHGTSAAVADKHVPFYHEKGLLKKFDTLKGAAEHLGLTEGVLLETFAAYDADAAKGEDAFGKKFFHNVPYRPDAGGRGPYYVGYVTPALHYTMGGIKVSEHGEVLKADGTKIEGLYAAGEAVGGVHGENRLGGNALTECVVFGKLVGERMSIAVEKTAAEPPKEAVAAAPKQAGLRPVSAKELGEHGSAASCWVSLYGKVYDFTDFLEDHPAGAEAILEYGGKDGTDIFDKVHTKAMLDDFEPFGVMAK